MSFNYLGAIKRPFTDFNKLLLGVLFLLIPIVNIITGFFVKGYRLEAAKSYNKKFNDLILRKRWGITNEEWEFIDSKIKSIEPVNKKLHNEK